ncbi:hypothetical protein [Rubripirellula reticaptiva]|uniref:Uncharacterized protein n=1 Tax=Rubripirellula reticaptiva TaxID=2528013 RepID=A0A5C6ET71_9BACT|nr:hypothetical protein [Rubripirellula reticaptiva]TWU51520.1 hypothetical protein Poly59_31120 [Rubripirellula reticaptiva]
MTFWTKRKPPAGGAFPFTEFDCADNLKFFFVEGLKICMLLGYLIAFKCYAIKLRLKVAYLSLKVRHLSLKVSRVVDCERKAFTENITDRQTNECLAGCIEDSHVESALSK